MKLTEKQQQVLARMNKGYMERKLSLIKTGDGWHIYSGFSGEILEKVNTLTVKSLIKKGLVAWADGLVGSGRLILGSGQWINY